MSDILEKYGVKEEEKAPASDLLAKYGVKPEEPDFDTLTPEQKVVAARPKSSYEGVSDNDLNIFQKAERAAQNWGLIKPGSEELSPASLQKKKQVLQHALNSAALGYLPQITGALKTGSVSNPDYIKARDEMVGDLDKADTGTRLSGQAIGMIPMAMAPAAKTATTALGGLARATGIGAAFGFAQNPGDTEGQLSGLMMPERINNAKRGALISGGLAAPFAANRLLRERFASKAGANADKVIEIADKIGVPPEEVPTEMLTDNQVVRDKAAALKRDPTFGGEIVRKRLQPFQDTVQNTAEGLVSEAAPVTESGAAVGTKVREAIPQKVEETLAPAKAVYDRIAGPMEKAEPWQHAMKQGTTKLMNDIAPQDSTGELRAIIQRERDHFLENIDTVADLKQYRTDIGKRARDAFNKGDSRTGSLYGSLYDILTSERDRSLERSILTSGRKIGREAKAIDTLKALRGADKAYAQGVQGSMDALGVQGKRTQGPQAAIKDYLNSKAVDQLPDTLWSPKDTEQAEGFKKMFPEQFDQIRRYQLGKVANAASKSGNLSPTSLDTQLNKMTPDAQGRLLGNNAKVLPDYRTLLKAMPDPNFNPSQTDIRRGTLTNWHPMNQAHSMLGAGELALRRPLPYVNDQGPMKTLFNNPYKGLAAQQPVIQRQNVMQKVEGTPYEQQLGQAKNDDDFALRYFSLSQTDPNFRSTVEPKEQ